MLKGTLLNAINSLMSKAMKLASDQKPNALLDADQSVGKPYPRVDGRLKVTGKAQYSAEYPLDGLTHAALVRSTIARGRITELDTAAEAVPGVLAATTYQNAPLKAPANAYVVNMANPLACSTISRAAWSAEGNLKGVIGRAIPA